MVCKPWEIILNFFSYRDLKPENILYSSTEETALLKIADFGLATLLRPNQMMNVACGTPGYVAPEILRGVAYGKEVDMWSIGVILYILLCGFPPFYDDNNKKLFALIINANYSFPDPYWTNISASGKDLVSKLLVVDPAKRLTAEATLSHPWMQEAGSSSQLVNFKENLRSYNARRRFRGAIRAVQLVSLLRAKKGVEPDMSLLAVVNSQDTSLRSRSIDNSDTPVLPGEHKLTVSAGEAPVDAVAKKVSSTDSADTAVVTK